MDILSVNGEYTLAVVKLKSLERFYLFNKLTEEDIYRHSIGEYPLYRELTPYNIKEIMRTPTIYQYLMGASEKDLFENKVLGNTVIIKKFYELLAKTSKLIGDIDDEIDGYYFKWVQHAQNKKLDLEFTGIEDWGVKADVIESVTTFKTLDELRKVRDLSFLDNKDYRILNEPRQIREYMANEFAMCEYPGVDTETTGLDVYNYDEADVAIGYVFSAAKDSSVYIPFKHELIDNANIKEVAEIVKPYLEKQKLIFHNAMFDKRVFYQEGIDANVYADTQIILHRLRFAESKKPLGLKWNTHEEFGVDTLELKEVTGSGNQHLLRYCDEDVVKAYACPDADYTKQLFHLKYPLLDKRSLPVFHNDMVFLRRFSWEEFHGVPVNKEGLIKGIKEAEEDLDIIQNEMYKYVFQEYYKEKELKKGRSLEEIKEDEEYKTGTVEFEISKPKDLKKVVFDILHHPKTAKLEKSGEYQLGKKQFKDFLREQVPDGTGRFEKDILGHYDETEKKKVTLFTASELNNYKYPFIALLKKWKDDNKNVTSFLKPMVRSIHNGRMYTNYSFTRADTTRMIDKVQTLKKSLRASVAAPKGQHMVVFDCAQEEIRIMLEMSGYNEMIDRLNNPEADAHRESGALFLNKKPYQISHEERSTIKGVAFGKPYGMGVSSMTQNICKPPITIKDEQRVEMINYKWEQAYKKVVKLLNDYREMAFSKGYTINKWGRVIYYDVKNATTTYRKGKIRRQAGNSPIQGYAADYLKLLFNKITRVSKEMGLEGKFWRPVNVHDEMVNWYDDDIHPWKIYKLIKDCAFTEGLNGMKFFWGVSIVDNWLDGKEDLYEAPVNFLFDKVKEYEANPEYFDSHVPKDAPKYVLDEILKWTNKRFEEEFNRCMGKEITANTIVDLDKIDKGFENYFLRSRMDIYIGYYRKPMKGEEMLYPAIEKFYIDKFGSMMFKHGDEYYTVTKDENAKEIRNTIGEKYEDSLEKQEREYQEQIEMEESQSEDFEIVGGDKGNIFDRVKFNYIDNITFKNNTKIISERNDYFIVPVDGLKKEEFEDLQKKLLDYKGNRQVVFTLKGKSYPSKIYVNRIDDRFLGYGYKVVRAVD